VASLCFFFQAEDGIRDLIVTGVQTCALPIFVMSEHAANMLTEIYGAPACKIDLIPHGVPDLPFMDPNYFKDMFGTEGKAVLLTRSEERRVGKEWRWGGLRYDYKI